jgi:hypothetical protein
MTRLLFEPPPQAVNHPYLVVHSASSVGSGPQLPDSAPQSAICGVCHDPFEVLALHCIFIQLWWHVRRLSTSPAGKIMTYVLAGSLAASHTL